MLTWPMAKRAQHIYAILLKPWRVQAELALTVRVLIRTAQTSAIVPHHNTGTVFNVLIELHLMLAAFILMIAYITQGLLALLVFVLVLQLVLIGLEHNVVINFFFLVSNLILYRVSVKLVFFLRCFHEFRRIMCNIFMQYWHGLFVYKWNLWLCDN